MARGTGTAGRIVKKRPRKAARPRRTPKTAHRTTLSTPSIDDLQAQLNEALDQQTATSEILKVISSSPGDLEQVFHAILAHATRICGAGFGTLNLYDGEGFRNVALHNVPKKFVEKREREPVIYPGPKNSLLRIVKTKRLIHIINLKTDEAYVDGDPPTRAFVDLAGARTVVVVPMLKNDRLIGTIGIYRQDIRRFTDRQIALVQNFAAQAVIAIENARLLNELRQRTDDLTVSLESQTANSEILGVISSSPGELQPVFDAILANASRLCEAPFGGLFLHDGGVLRFVARRVPPLAPDAMFQEGGAHEPALIVSDNLTHPLVRMLSTKQTTHIPDLRMDESYVERNPRIVALVESVGARTFLVVPMLKDEKLVGEFAIFRLEVRPFADKQIALLQNFAAQAVIAIENARLLNELRQRTDDLSESLEQQTATSEVLQFISSSPGKLEPVFQAMLKTATRICEAKFGNMYLRKGDVFHFVAAHNTPPAFIEERTRATLRPEENTILGRMMRAKSVVHVTDLTSEEMYVSGHPRAVAAAELGGVRTFVFVPLIKEAEVVGYFAIFRQEVRPFTEKQIELLRNFATQAVIAIENTRLLNELRQRTDDLTESLEQQTATSEVLKIISSSPGELGSVFQIMLESAVRICEASFGMLFRIGDGVVRAVGMVGVPPAFAEFWNRGPQQPGPRTALGRVIQTHQTIHVVDVKAEPAYIEGEAVFAAAVNLGGFRSLINVPVLKDKELIGTITIYRQEVRPFSDKQIELVQNFAAQAVIAIENARLLNELRESLQQQTATADALKVISRSAFDLRTVLQILIESAARFCDADKATIIREKDGAFYRTEAYGFSREFLDYVKDIPIEADRGSAAGRTLLEGQVVHIPDVRADPEYTLVEAQRLGDYRTILCVPMLREGIAIGVLVLTRNEVRPFNEKQIELVTTFADQASIAIENARLFESVEARTRELAQSLEDLRTTQDRLVQTEKLASLGQLTAGIAHEIKNPLNFVNNFSGVSIELIDELQATLGTMKADDKTVAEITELSNTLRGNLDKVVQHGKRADSIVKNMLQHSRQGSAEHRLVDINALVEESLNLAYHGARAEKEGFNITLERSLDPAAGEADIFPQDITRVLLNLIANGFYAATRRKAQADGGDYEPTLAASTKDVGDRVEIRIRDNGIGIPPEVKEQMFNPFFTTKPAGEGTGLGLSISHDIIVKQHGGSIEVDTKPGEFTEIKIALPRSAAFPS